MTASELLVMLGRAWSRLILYPGGLAAFASAWLALGLFPRSLSNERSPHHLVTPSSRHPVTLARSAIVLPWLALALLPLPVAVTLPRQIDIVVILTLLEWPQILAIGRGLRVGEIRRLAAALNGYPLLILATLALAQSTGSLEVAALMRVPGDLVSASASTLHWLGAVALALALPPALGLGPFAHGGRWTTDDGPFDAAQGRRSTTDDGRSTIDKRRVATEDPQLTTAGWRAATEDPRPTTEARRAATEAQKAMTEDPRLRTEAPQSATAEPRAATEAQPPTTEARRAATEAQPPTTEARRAATGAWRRNVGARIAFLGSLRSSIVHFYGTAALRMGLRLRALGLIALAALPWSGSQDDGAWALLRMLAAASLIAALLWGYDWLTRGQLARRWARVYLALDGALLLALLSAAYQALQSRLA